MTQRMMLKWHIVRRWIPDLCRRNRKCSTTDSR